MRNWKFLLTSQLLRGYWFLNLDHAHGAGPDLEMLLNPNANLKDFTEDLLASRGAYNFSAIQAGGGAFAQTGLNPSYDKLPKGSVAAFGVSGSLLKHGTMCSYGTEEIAAQMMEAAYHKNISGALINIDSGGGAVNAIGPIAEAVKKFRAMGKPVLAHCDATYSAAYWLASEANHIMAQNDISAGFGSIGVMMSFADVKGHYESKGYKLHTVYAPESTEKNKGYELALEGKYDEIQLEELSPLAQRFHAAVKENRGSKLNLADDKILKGKTYSAQKSVANGLADSIGNSEAAVQMLFDLIAAQQFVTNK